MESVDYNQWLGRKQAETCVANLNKHGFEALFFSNSAQARTHILETITGYESFGFGGSDTTRSLDIIEGLKQQQKIVYDHWEKDLSPEASLDIRRNQSACDCFFCSANAISMTGEIINVDGVGNRTNAMTFGPRKVVIVAGINKLTMDIETALQRVRTVAGPMRAKSLGMQTPCAETGICTDCNAPQRICRITTILHRKPMLTDMTVIIINEALGF
jgi:LUD domain